MPNLDELFRSRSTSFDKGAYDTKSQEEHESKEDEEDISESS